MVGIHEPRTVGGVNAAGFRAGLGRDLTGFEDGTENPSLMDAPAVATVPDGEPGAGGTVRLFRPWRHEIERREALSVEQERVMGRTKGAGGHRLQRMLERMASAGDGVRDALRRYSRPLTGSYSLAPSLQAMKRFANDEAD